MGLHIPALRYLIREHRRRPFNGPVLSLGRQGVYATADDIQALLTAERLPTHALLAPADRFSNLPQWREGPNRSFASDRAFWAMLAGLEVEALDVDRAEGPDHVIDLNDDVPPDLEGRFGLVLDGGTLEHVFDAPRALRNVARMLRSDGRAIHFSPASNYCEHGYYQLSPTLFFDYYGTNGFEDLHCILASHADTDTYYPDWEWSVREWSYRHPEAITSPDRMLAVFRAQKTPVSTVDRIPRQGDHRRQRAAVEHQSALEGRLAVLVCELATQRPEPLAVYGAGEVGACLATALARANIEVACFVDGDPALWGRRVGMHEVVSLEEATRRGIACYAVGSLASVERITDAITHHAAGQRRTVHIFTP